MELENQHLFDHGEYLLKLALKKVDNFEQAEDLVSETYISALSAIKNGKQIENPQAYLSGILNHKFEDFLRSKYSKPVISYGVIPEFGIAAREGGPSWGGTASWEPESALDKLIKKEAEENVRRIIAGLSKNYREVLVRHFIYGQNVKSIANQLKVKPNTVKSRLNTARMNVKSQMEKKEMEKYEKQSYEPEQLEIWVYGEMENDCSAFYTNDWTRRIQQNILIMAYKKPLTITELSQGLGISAAYIEPIVDELISYDFMVRKGDKFFTSFIIFSQEEKDKAYDHDKAIAEKYAQKMWCQLEAYLDQVRNLDCYKKLNERQRASLLQFSVIFMIHEAVREIKAQKIPKPDVMNVKHKAKWQGYAYGFQSPLDYKPDWDYVSGHELCKLNGCHVVSTGPYKKHQNVSFYAYSVAAGFTFTQFWPLDPLQFLKVCYALYAKEENDIPLIAPKFFDPEVIETYEKYNFLEKRKVTKVGSDETGALKQGALEDANLQQETFDGTFKPHNGDLYVESLNLPVLQADEVEALFGEIYHPCILDFAEKFHSELEELLVNPVEVPKHLKDLVPEGLKYQQCGDAFVMALLYQGAWNGWYKNDYARKNEPVPALVICLGKELGEEERK